jgi:ABC-type lipoprotein export system ATPase subunit
MNEIIIAENVRKTYRRRAAGVSDRTEDVEVLRSINLTVQRGEYVSIMGRSGSGKSTLLNILGMTMRPTDGLIRFEGRDTADLWNDELADIRRRKIGFIFQDFDLLESISALDNIMLAGYLDKKNETEVRPRAIELAGRLNLSEQLLRKYPHELSGGEQQRVAVTRALMNNPDLILADEPTGNLDAASESLVANMLSQIHQEMGKSIILVTHNPKLAAQSEIFYHLTDGGVLDAPIRYEGNREAYYHRIIGQM